MLSLFIVDDTAVDLARGLQLQTASFSLVLDNHLTTDRPKRLHDIIAQPDHSLPSRMIQAWSSRPCHSEQSPIIYEAFG